MIRLMGTILLLPLLVLLFTVVGLYELAVMATLGMFLCAAILGLWLLVAGELPE